MAVRASSAYLLFECQGWRDVNNAFDKYDLAYPNRTS
jgi:hypothetical protein